MNTNWKTIKSGTLTAQAKIFDTATTRHLTAGSGQVVTKLWVEDGGKFIYQYDRGDVDDRCTPAQAQRIQELLDSI